MSVPRGCGRPGPPGVQPGGLWPVQGGRRRHEVWQRSSQSAQRCWEENLPGAALLQHAPGTAAGSLVRPTGWRAAGSPSHILLDREERGAPRS